MLSLTIFYCIKLLILGKLLLLQLYFIHLGIGTYDHILERRQIDEINENLKMDYISKEEYEKKKREILDQRKIDLNDRNQSRVIQKTIAQKFQEI